MVNAWCLNRRGIFCHLNVMNQTENKLLLLALCMHWGVELVCRQGLLENEVCKTTDIYFKIGVIQFTGDRGMQDSLLVMGECKIAGILWNAGSMCI